MVEVVRVQYQNFRSCELCDGSLLIAFNCFRFLAISGGIVGVNLINHKRKIVDGTKITQGPKLQTEESYD